jgi:hypothetical protein
MLAELGTDVDVASMGLDGALNEPRCNENRQQPNGAQFCCAGSSADWLVVCVDVFEADLVDVGVLVGLGFVAVRVAVLDMVVGVLDVGVGVNGFAVRVLVDVVVLMDGVVAHRFLLGN